MTVLKQAETAKDGDKRAQPAERRALVLRALRDVVGFDHLRDDPITLERYARSTAARSTVPLAVVYPGSQAEVAALVRVAARHQIAVYPISTGKNWGYGDACAVTSGQLVIELSRMNRIVTVEPILAYAVIEPGVTQQQLSQYLLDHKLDLWIDCTGAGVVGSALQGHLRPCPGPHRPGDPGR